MIRRLVILGFAVWATAAQAQIVTNDAAALVRRSWSHAAGTPYYVRVIAVQGATPIDLTDRRVTWTVRHVDTEALVLLTTGTIHRATAGEVIFRWTPTAAGTYRSVAEVVRSDTGEPVAQVMDDEVAVTSGAAATTVNLSVNPTAQVNVAVSPTATVSVTIQQITTGLLGVATSPTNAYAPPTTNAGVVTIPIPTNAGGGSSSVSINGHTGTSFTVQGMFPVMVTNSGGTIYVGWYTFDGILVIPFGTNTTVINYSGSITQQYVVGVAKSNVLVTLWGAAGASQLASFGGAGGFAQVSLPVTNGAILDCIVGQGGQAITGTPWVTDRAFPNGGRGAGRQANGGGGRSEVRLGTNIIAIAGGGGGSHIITYSGGGGGGTTGGDAQGSAAGKMGLGGSQTNGGAIASTSGVILYTNTAGSYLQGGDGGCTTNIALAATTGNGAGGGDGYYGGSGGFASSSEFSGGGAGSGYWNPSFCSWGITIRGDVGTTANPPGTELSGYVAGVGVPGGSHPSTRAGNGLILVTVQ